MKNRFIKFAALCLALVLLLSVPALADTVGGATVKADALNLRSEESAASTSKMLIPNGAFLLVEQKNGDWYKVMYNGQVGYVSAKYINFSENLDGTYNYTATVAGDNVRLRAGASTSSAILGVYSTGTQLTVLGVSGNWLKVSVSGTVGYIRSDFVGYGGTASTGYVSTQSKGEQIVATAKEYLGTKYVWGGMSTSGFDCSGFVNYVYKLYDYSMNRVAQSIFSYDGTWVDKEDLQPGDLVFFGYSGSSVSHVGMYIGDGQFIHSSSSAGQVVITDLSQSYYTRMYVGAKRIIA
jgi:cell wall-associated NlpC family hydrolase